MKTSTGLLILLIVAAVFAGGVYLFAQKFAQKQTPASEEVETGTVETLNLQGVCSGDWDSCCSDECSSFCKERKEESVKEFANNHLCTCWCE